MHLIVFITIIHHATSYGGRSVFLVRQDTYLPGTFYQGAVKLMPRTTRERNDAHVVIRYHKPVGEHLKGVKGGINHNVRIRHLPPYGIGKAEEQRVTAGKDHHLVVILLKDSIERHGDINPLCILRKQRLHNLMVALATREHFSVPYHL